MFFIKSAYFKLYVAAIENIFGHNFASINLQLGSFFK